ncbi:MAG: DUF4298 domain-containing protein [Candidatus Riflebacteria bacterium]|nr:DUF4298 domain-containing protein [Candidatus Riflebacteria bacterium]
MNNSQVERIKRMERILVEGKIVVENLNKALEEYRHFRSDIKELQNYYENGNWMEDFKDDEAGKLPKDLKRGVLSEDGIYNFLSDYDEINRKLKIEN